MLIDPILIYTLSQLGLLYFDPLKAKMQMVREGVLVTLNILNVMCSLNLYDFVVGCK